MLIDNYEALRKHFNFNHEQAVNALLFVSRLLSSEFSEANEQCKTSDPSCTELNKTRVGRLAIAESVMIGINSKLFRYIDSSVKNIQENN